MKKSALLLALAGLTTAANAQLVVGVDDPTVDVFEVRVSDNSNVATSLFNGFEAWGMAADPVNEIIYFNDGSSLYSWDGVSAPLLLGTITIDGADTSVVSLAFDEGTLYATRNIGGDGSPSAEGLYTIDFNTLEATLVLDYDSASYDFGGLAVLDGVIYGTNDAATTFGAGLYRIELNGTITLVTPYPAGETDIDGLAAGDGFAYLVEDEAGETIHPWNFSEGTYEATITSPFTSSEIFSGAAWAPWLAGTAECPGDVADDFGFEGADGQVSFGDFLFALTILGPCPGGTPGCAFDIADDFGFEGADGQVSFGDFLFALTVLGPCP